MSTTYPQIWNLDTLFPGGSTSPELIRFFEETERDTAALNDILRDLAAPTAADEFAPLLQALELVQSLSVRTLQAEDYTYCLSAQNTKDIPAQTLVSRAIEAAVSYESALIRFDHLLANMADDVWNVFLQQESVSPVAFVLSERRQRVTSRLAPELEELANDLSVDGYHASHTLQKKLLGALRVPVQQEGETRLLSVAQANALLRNPDRAVRLEAGRRLNAAAAEQAELFAHALNHLGGFRLQLYKHRGWDSVVREPLERNRMSEATLDSMWDAVERNTERFLPYLERKAKLLGAEKLSTFDAAMTLGTSFSKMSYQEAAAFIMEQFARFSPNMADVARRAFAEGWIESENRPNKMPGGFAALMPVHKQSRIFMTFSGELASVSGTLAHELGHVYHHLLMYEMEPLNQRYAKNVAETASNFAENLVADAALRHAKSQDERIALLDVKLSNAASSLLRVYSMYLFEKRFYDERRKGLVSVERLNELTNQATLDAYRGGMEADFPLQWAVHAHKYDTQEPFYNFPYTFGYLFSNGVYAQALAEGPSFAARYDALLRDTGRMTTEALAEKHLGVDLKKSAFWQSSIDYALSDLDEFLSLTE